MSFITSEGVAIHMRERNKKFPGPYLVQTFVDGLTVQDPFAISDIANATRGPNQLSRQSILRILGYMNCVKRGDRGYQRLFIPKQGRALNAKCDECHFGGKYSCSCLIRDRSVAQGVIAKWGDGRG